MSLLPPHSIVFISDVHLNDKAPALTALLIAFLQGPAQHASALYILGDLFNVWVGEDLLPSSIETSLTEALRALSNKNIPVYFMPGNRDFLISDEFLHKMNMIRLPDRHVISLYGTPTLLMHGDLLCTQDKPYQRYRKIAQHPWTRRCFLALPHGIRKKITNSLRKGSQTYQKKQNASILDVTPEAVIAEMQKAHTLQLLHGHTHRPAFHSFPQGQHMAQRWVLGDWQETAGSVIIATPTQIQLATFMASHTFAVLDSVVTTTDEDSTLAAANKS